MKTHTLTILCLILIFRNTTSAQFSAGFEKLIPQTVLVNPAQPLQPGGYLQIFPLSGMSIDFSNSGFALDDVFNSDNGGTLQLTPDKLLDALSDENLFREDTRMPLLACGFKTGKKLYLHTSVQDVTSVRCNYGEDLFKFLLEGNGSYLGQQLSLGDVQFNAVHYADFSMGFTWIENKWSIGVRGHFLYGLNCATVGDATLDITTDPETYAIDATAHLDINTANLSEDFLNTLKESKGKAAFHQQNTGWGGDFGVLFYPTKHLSVGAALKNIGFIHWRTGVVNYQSGPAEIHFEGIGLSDLAGVNEDGLSGLESLADSLKSVLAIKQNHTDFNSQLIPEANVSVGVLLNNKLDVGVIARAEKFNGKCQSMYTAYADLKPVRWLSFSPSCSYDWNKEIVVGMGAMVRMGTVQCHAATSNVLSFIDPMSAQSFSVSAGINFLFGARHSKARSANQ